MSPRHVDTCPFCGGPDYVPHEVIECGKAKLNQMRSRCEKAEAALRPFATMSHGYAKQSDNYEVAVDLIFLRRAREALDAAGEGKS